MAESELSKALKDLPNRVQAASLTDRPEIFLNVTKVLTNPGITEPMVRGICKVIQLTLPKYRDAASQSLVKALIIALSKHHPEWTVRHMTAVLKDIAAQHKNATASKNTAQSALYTLGWSSLVLMHAVKQPLSEPKLELQTLVHLQADLLHTVTAAGVAKYTEMAQNMLVQLWSAVDGSVEFFLSSLASMDQGLHTVVLASHIIKHLLDTGKVSLLTPEYKAVFLDTFIKNLISVKSKPNTHVVLNSNYLLKQFSEQDFKVSILPALQKSMLRSPEIIIECVGEVIGNTSVDMSKYAMDIGKTLISNLHSKEALTREEASVALKNLSSQCSQADAIESLLKHVFSVFNGSEGKLTIVEYKTSVLQGAGNLTFNKIGGEIEKVANVAIDLLIKVLENESLEKILVCALEVFGLWGQKLQVEVPKKVVDAFKNGLSLKTSTAAVRTAYNQMLLACLEHAKLPSKTDLESVLLKTVERAASQCTQVAVVAEGLCAACLLLKCVGKQYEPGKLTVLWTAILDMDKPVFLSEKFLSAATDDTLYHVMLLCEQLIVNHYDRINGDPAPLFNAIIYCLTTPLKIVRSKCMLVAKKLISTNSGPQLTRNLLKQFEKFLETVKISDSNECNDTVVTPQYLIDFLITICSSANLKVEDAQLIALDSLLCAHHSNIVNAMSDLWIKILNNLKLSPKEYVGLFSKSIKNKLIEGYVATPSYENALATIVRINPDVFLPSLIATITSRLEDESILKITKDEYFTFLTPEGELFDKSGLPGNDEDELNKMNMKRESKAYSYKDQLEEMQLRRELMEKKKREGKVVELTPKQKEAIKIQTEKENAIRTRLSEIDKNIATVSSMITAAMRGDGFELSLHFADLLPSILNNLKSPLAAPYFIKIYPELRKTVFEDDLADIGELIAHVTVRLYEPCCDLEAHLTEGDLDNAVLQTLNKIYDLTIKSKSNDFGSEIPQDHFTAAQLCYSFPFLKMTLNSKCAKNDESVVHDALQIISDHAKIRGSYTDASKKDPHHPKYLPRLQMLELLIDIISSTTGRIQSQAVSTLLEVAETGSNKEGCARASTNEIDCLLSALQNPSEVVRDAGLRAMGCIVDAFPTLKEDYDQALRITKRLWIAKFDISKEIGELADSLWIEAGLELPVVLCDELLNDVIHPVHCIQQASALALAAILEQDTSLVPGILDQLLELYKEKLTLIPAKLDQFDRLIEQPIDLWSPRRGVALAFAQLAPLLDSESVILIMNFLVSTGLGDRKNTVQKEMLTAALNIVELHGKETVSSLLPVFEDFLDKASKSSSFDNKKQAVVILMGSLARHLEKDDPRIKPIVMRLIAALSTPSQQVQEAVANCLPYLITSVKDDAPNIVQKLLHQLLKSDKYGDRKGAAYGLAGLVKGLGILSLKQLDIMNTLTNAIQEKKNYKYREGALFAFEMLCTVLGRLFEPYIVHVLPHLLLCFGDTSQYVRTATDDTSKVVMSKLSAHGVKLVLPSLLAALEEDNWRTKTGSVELLGAMAFCAPKQLSSCLPSIVPKLIEVLSDSHMKVQAAGADALKVIGSVIRNPEIQAIVPVLLEALQDPSNKTSASLQTLLDTQFVHFIDAPSLALIMPVVQRAFMDRSTETRKMAAQIIGNMYSLTDQKDLTPYLPNIIPGLKMSLLDPVPEVRSVSARALGAMVRGMGEASFEDLLPWLMQTLTSETSSVDRSGAAQGLSEVVGGLGVEKMHKLMPEIIATAERTDIAPHVKDGYIMMFIYMPNAFTAEFTPYIGQIINPILKALADENEYVRDTALKAGQRIVNLYADSAIMLLLPELERGLFDENWRIRYSSVQLLGDLLYRISGVSGKMSTETASEDDNFGTEQSHTAIITALGAERRNRVLAGLYMGRSDVALMVRQAALHVWKVVVTNTPRTLREILPTLFSLLLGCLASTSYDKRQVAARTLGDLVRKLGERVLPEIIPILEKGLQSEQADQRQGVCIGLSEIMASTSRDMVLSFVNSLVPTVRKALCDPLPEVRSAAAKTFDSLHSTVGVRALDDILPAMLNNLNNPDPAVAESTLDGLRQVMAIKSRVVLPYLVPQLTAPPVNTKALSILASVAGEALNKYLNKILPALLTALSTAQGTPEEAQELEYCQAVVLSVNDEVGVRTIMDTLMEATRSEQTEVKRSAATLLCAFCSHSRADYSQYVPQLLRGIIRLFTDQDKDVLQRSWEALMAVTKTLDSDQQIAHVGDVRQAVRYAISDQKGTKDLLPGFCLPKGITPILPIFREAILNGLPEEKESATLGLGEVIKLTSPQALQPSVVHITGPLIRILGDRFNAGVKAAVLETLALLLSKVGVMLKQFLPQLQTTFLKSLSDSNRAVRIKAGYALSQLVLIHNRADPLFVEMHNGIKTSEDSAVRETMLQALRSIISPAGDKMSDPLRKQVLDTLTSMLDIPDDVSRGCAAGCLGALCRWLSPEQLDTALAEHILCDDPSDDWTLRHGRSATISVALKECPGTVYTEQYQNKICKVLLSYMGSDKVQVASNGIRSCGYLFKHLMETDQALPTNLVAPFVRTMNHNSNDVKQLLARVCMYVARVVPPEKMAPELLKLLLPMLVNGTKEKNGYVKANSELALVAVLQLRHGDETQKRCMALLDVGARESLSDVVSKVLRKTISQPEGKEEELDDTLIS